MFVVVFYRQAKNQNKYEIGQMQINELPRSQIMKGKKAPKFVF